MTLRRACVVLFLLSLALALVAAVVVAVLLRVTGPPGPGSETLGRQSQPVPSGPARGEGTLAQPGTSPPSAGGAESGPSTVGPQTGGRLHLAGVDPTTLDPALVRDVVSAEYLYEIYSGLVTLSPDLEVVPDLAVGWEVDPTGTVYTFTLRADALFQDGSPITAGDVAFAIERACDPATGSQVAATYLGDIVGCLDRLAGRASAVAGVAVPDPDRLVLTIDAPKAYFLAKLTYPTAFVLDRRQMTDDRWTEHPNGSGPFRLASYVPHEELVLERNEHYYGSPAYLEAVVFDLRPVTAVTLYENGELDAVPVGLGDLERVHDPLNPLSREVVEGPAGLGLTYLGFNVRRAPFDDVAVRRAFNYALDKERLARVVLQGAVTPADWILPPGMPGHTPDVSPYRYDPAAARAALAASRYGGATGLPALVLNASGEGGSNTTAEAVADMIGQVLGVEIAVEQAPWDLFQEEVASGEYAMYLLGWSADYPDPQDFLDVLFHSQSPLNHTGYADPEVDRLLEEARLAPHERRLELYRRAERRILEDAPWLPLYSGVETWLVAPYVHGFTIPGIVRPRLAAVWLSTDAR